jgi:hypothetical protein
MAATGNDLCINSERREAGRRRGAGGFDAEFRLMTFRDSKSAFLPCRTKISLHLPDITTSVARLPRQNARNGGSDCLDNDHEWDSRGRAGRSGAITAAWRAKQNTRPPRRSERLPTHGDPTLTPEEFAEFVDFLEFDEAPAAVPDCADYDPEQ